MEVLIEPTLCMRMRVLMGGVWTINGTPRATTLLCRFKNKKKPNSIFSPLYDPLVRKNIILINWAENGFNDVQS